MLEVKPVFCFFDDTMAWQSYDWQAGQANKLS
jgi:hypothetical protein